MNTRGGGSDTIDTRGVGATASTHVNAVMVRLGQGTLRWWGWGRRRICNSRMTAVTAGRTDED